MQGESPSFSDAHRPPTAVRRRRRPWRFENRSSNGSIVLACISSMLYCSSSGSSSNGCLPAQAFVASPTTHVRSAPALAFRGRGRGGSTNWAAEMAFPAPKTGGRRCFNTALAFTRQQMIDMGLVPPEGAEQEAQDLLLSRAPSTEEEEEEEEEGAGGHPAAMADDAEEPAEAVGLIGHFEASRLLAQKGKEETFVGSLDMSMTERELVSTEEGVALPPSPAAGDAEPNLVASWDELAVVLKKAKKGQYGCWELYADGNTPCKVSDMSESTSRPAMLCAPLRSAGAPTMVLGGFAMHRISGGDQKSTMEPGLDTEHKVSASGARRTNGRVLDTCTGLGYTAIAAARCRGVSGVVTVELDEVSLRMCRRNPWSQEMFRNEKITSLLGDCCELVKDFDDGEFAAIIHDPPARALCKTTDMYGAAFYKDLARVLKPGGTLFHYIGNPESNEGGRLFRGVIDRLIGAGFHDCKTDKKAFGVVARR